MLKRVLKLMCLGFVLGMIIGDGITLLIGYISQGDLVLAASKLVDMMGSEAKAFILQSLILGAYGMIAWAGIVLYEVDRLPLMIATGLHCLMVIVPFVPVALFCGWTGSLIGVLIMSGCQFIGFVIVWLIMSAIYKKQVKELNEIQEHLKENKGK